MMFSLAVPSKSFGHFLLGPSNARQTLGTHVRIVRTLVVVGINDDQDLVVIAIQKRDGASRSEYVIIGMWGEHQNCFVVKFFEARLLRLP